VQPSTRTKIHNQPRTITETGRWIRAEHLRPIKPGTREQPGFNSFRYTVDLLLPVANFKQRDGFVADGWAAWASFGFTFAGWLLAAIVVAALAGVDIR
jgi:hypothetical protein